VEDKPCNVAKIEKSKTIVSIIDTLTPRENFSPKSPEVSEIICGH